jgi:sugar/nucleoside kinase (ribokinase family)
VIVVVGDPSLRLVDGGAPAMATGAAAAIALACARAGATVQLVGKVGDDPPGDEILLTLTRDGIGHVALLRDAGTRTAVDHEDAAEARDGVTGDDEWAVPSDDDPAAEAGTDAASPATARRPPAAPTSSLAPEDLDLALRYLSSFGVLVVAQPLSPPTLAVAVESAAFAGAHLILIDAPEQATAAVAGVPVDDITALESPPTDPEGDFTGLVGRYAAALDAGTPAAAAFRTALGAAGWEAATV